MNKYFVNLESYGELSSSVTDSKIIRIFDFDGTIFNSPTPNPSIWDRKMYGKLRSHFNDGGYGWYQNVITLNDEYIDVTKFNHDVIEAVRSSMADPNSITVMLTGRTSDYESQVKRILSKQNLVFDEYGFKPINGSDTETTMNFKKRFIKDLLAKYDNVVGIEMWDDRVRHINKFDQLLNELDLNAGVHYVNYPEYHIPDADVERSLVDILISDNRVVNKPTANKRPIYYGVLLTPSSKQQLLQAVGKYIPDGWRIYAHHMTILFGKYTDDTILKYIHDNMGREVILYVTDIGISDEAIAVKIDSDVPCHNKIPHVTVATPANGKPVNSNRISDWKPIELTITLKGNIFAHYGD